MKRFTLFMLAIFFLTMLAGCGETIGGVGKDVSRIGKGIKTIFVKDGSN